MNDVNANDYGKLVLRVFLAVLLLMHGVPKLIKGVSGIAGMLEGAGLPGFLAYGVLIGEVLAPILLIAGFYARVGAVLVVVNMLFAIGLVHSHEIFQLTQGGHWKLELQGFFLFTAVALALMGPGRIAVNQR